MTTFLRNVTPVDPVTVEVNQSVSILIEATNDAGAPVAGYQIQLICPSDPSYPGAVSGSYTGATNGSGIATLLVRANTVVGGWTANAYGYVAPYVGCAAGVINDASTQPATPSRLVFEAGAGQTANPNTVLAQQLTCVVYDQYNQRWPGGVSITATAPASGPSGTFAATGTRTQTLVSDANGWVGFSAFTTNSTLGSFNITMSAPGCAPVTGSVTIKNVSEVCTPGTGVPIGTFSNNFTNPQNWIGNNFAYAYISVAPNLTTQQIIDSWDLSALLSGVDGASQVTTITVTHYVYYGRAAANGPTRFNINLQSTALGVFGAVKQNDKGASPDNTRIKFTNVWSTFQNTGNPGNKLYINQINIAGSAGAVVRGVYPANEGDVTGDVRVSEMRIVVCYLPAGGGDEQSIALQICEV